MTSTESCVDNQQGFQYIRSCETQLPSMVQEKDNKTESLAQNFYTKHKLDRYGVKDNVKRWVEPFLGQRIEQVVFDGVGSDTAAVFSGVPQGTVLAKLFADDSLLFSHQKNGMLSRKIYQHWSRALGETLADEFQHHQMCSAEDLYIEEAETNYEHSTSCPVIH